MSAELKWWEAVIDGKHYTRKRIFGNGRDIITPTAHLVSDEFYGKRHRTACGLDAVIAIHDGGRVMSVSDYDPFCKRCQRKAKP